MMSQPPNFLACPSGLEALNFYATGNRYLLRGLCSLSLRAWPIRPLLSCWMPSEGTSKLITIVSLIWGRYSNCARAFLPCRGALHCTTTAVKAASEPAPWSFCSLDWRILKDTEGYWKTWWRPAIDLNGEVYFKDSQLILWWQLCNCWMDINPILEQTHASFRFGCFSGVWKLPDMVGLKRHVGFDQFWSILGNTPWESERIWTKLYKLLERNWCKFKRHDQNPRVTWLGVPSKKVQQRLASHIISQYIFMVSPYISPSNGSLLAESPTFGAIHLFIVFNPPLWTCWILIVWG